MKKISAVILVFVLLAALAATPTFAAEEFDYVCITASGNDPYATFRFNSSGNHTSIDPDTVKWAAIKYRTETETDNTGVQLIGQFYISPAAEPFIPIKYNHTKQWETTVVDLTSVSEKTSLSSKWNTTSYTDLTSIRFDPLESNRDAELQQSETDTAVVSNGDKIYVAFIAFFENEEDARAYDGTQDTPYCIILPEDLEWYESGNAIDDVEVIEGKKPRPADDTTIADTTEEATAEATEAETEVETEAETEAETAAETEAEDAEGTKDTAAETEAEGAEGTKDTAEEAVTDENGNEVTGVEETGEETTAPVGGSSSSDGGFPTWAIAAIAGAGAVLIAAVVLLILKNKKK